MIFFHIVRQFILVMVTQNGWFHSLHGSMLSLLYHRLVVFNVSNSWILLWDKQPADELDNGNNCYATTQNSWRFSRPSNPSRKYYDNGRKIGLQGLINCVSNKWKQKVTHQHALSFSLPNWVECWLHYATSQHTKQMKPYKIEKEILLWFRKTSPDGAAYSYQSSLNGAK